jgi:UDP-3-O-[3-hydroxymyristoyl] glucosamine N-acyltransferase
MNFEKTYTLKDLFEGFQVTIKGEKDGVKGLNEIHRVREGDLSFVDHPKYYDKSLQSAASFILIDKDVDIPENKTIIICEEPFIVFNAIAEKYTKNDLIKQEARQGLDPSIIVEPGAIIHPEAEIGAGSFIHANAVIGPKVRLGKNVIVHYNACIGTDAFYFHKKEGKMTKWHTVGSVVIGDDVEIGAACTISRGVSSPTIIGGGTKLDAQVHIGHGVIIGEDCTIAAQAGISGKTIIGDKVVIYGQAGIAQNLHIGDGAIIAAKAGVAKDLEGGQTYFGVPARDMKTFYREFVSLKNLPDLIQTWRKK